MVHPSCGTTTRSRREARFPARCHAPIFSADLCFRTGWKKTALLGLPLALTREQGGQSEVAVEFGAVD